MSSTTTSRERILGRLHAACARAAMPLPGCGDVWQAADIPVEERIPLLKKRMETVRAEVHVMPEAEWPNRLAGKLSERDVKTLAYGPEAWFGAALRKKFKGKAAPSLVPYEGDVEAFRDTLFDTDAGITGTLGGIAENGTLILWPDAVEPRLLSLVPSIHIALLKADSIHATFASALRDMGWAKNMPTNALLISGPSKTADIEMTLAFGVHGPRELIVLVLE
ncbi:LutC/YkgG family protein [Nitratidesulfovibrio vulgaris]|uniref:LUD domain-containing protein n=1 Tax=Nitratidesulfovibrio vulgaris (strain ATCC 29579 / DSM 644 / CCUG 34227 / NCIMB 8303 / VKM B-1760 / Hildenborough) TaxID=882 RepID=Q72B57_NITV2|nr:lactate utilization protein [Nitratidesulfovibrio vulgaris]AAS96258.1 conserved hypothetical protein [Nitratidesulfovibrio vulgaris str. Hildenborough]ADP86675.1 protein of unknown function DUF162 [Nitratidesulfovibrio vulgaris RCH1]